MIFMLIISPRSYVTAAFDLLFPVVAECIVTWLKYERPDDWWEFYIYIPREEIFGKETIRRKEENTGKLFPEKGDIEDFKEYFDEYYTNKLINKRGFKPKHSNNHDKKVASLLSEVGVIRNRLAHPGIRDLHNYRVLLGEREWAESSILKTREFANHLKKDVVAKRISILLFKMKCDWIDDNTDLPSHDELIKWLNKHIIRHVIAKESPIKDDYKKRVQKSFENLKHYVKESSEHAAPRYVIDYYWNAIRAKTDVYDEIKSHDKKRITTFEDVVEGFTNLCYKK